MSYMNTYFKWTKKETKENNRLCCSSVGEAEIEAAIRDVSGKQRKELSEFHFTESQQCENKQQREWHNKSLTSFLPSL